MKKFFFVFAILIAFCFITISTIDAQAQSPRSKCPPNSKCGLYTGLDEFETSVQISNSVFPILRRWNIRLENGGTVLTWVKTCNKKGCDSVDLTGRKPGEKIAKHDLNAIVKITTVSGIVRIYYEEFDGDYGEFLIIGGIFTPVQRLN